MFLGVVVKLIPPEVDSVNTTIPGTVHFNEDVFPKDSLEQNDPTTIGFSFTKSDDPSINRYGNSFNVSWFVKVLFCRIPCDSILFKSIILS